MMGTRGFAGALPPICAEPVKAGVKLIAFNVTVSDEKGLFGVHVADQRPPWKLVSASGGSPFENAVTTDPEDIGEPQSSTMEASIAEGQATGLTKFTPSSVKTGHSLAGLQAAGVVVSASASRSNPLAIAPAATTKSRFTTRAFPSENRYEIDPL